ncbi:WXG100 family type VII secretion target [Lachnospiraceae bacterium C10]|jgi:WXG100 family type VII secretion target|nr:WXG100 family type VII secretion target [Lachnospiraceae bacterium]SCW78895.1 WXG100 family type VII secretion target [Lachnospiraceae bacterium C10]SDW24622.1 WXG100 family type VII secretion target [Lachnospiraceae bacterium KHCPX20]
MASNYTIKVDPAELKKSAKQFTAKANEIKTLTSKMTSLITGVTGSVWKGEAQTSYTHKFTSLNDDIRKLNKLVVDEAQKLERIAKEYEAKENANIAVSRSLKENII